jgi:hypothetical protein
MKKILIYILLSTAIFAGGTGITLEPIINIKHQKPITSLLNTNNYIITHSKYESKLKIWDKKTIKLIKTFDNIKLSSDLYLNNNIIYFHNTTVLYLIDLETLSIKPHPIEMQYDLETVMVGDIKYDNKHIFVPFFRASRFDNPHFLFGYYKMKLKYIFHAYMPIKNKYLLSSDIERADLDDVKWSKDNKAIFFKYNNLWYKFFLNKEVSVDYMSDIKKDIYKNINQYTNYKVKTKLYEVKDNNFYEPKKELFNINYKNNPKNKPFTTVKYGSDYAKIMLNNKAIFKAPMGGRLAPDSYFQNSFYTTNKGHIITSGFIGWEINPDSTYSYPSGYFFFVFNKYGDLLRMIKRLNEYKVDKKYTTDIFNSDEYHKYITDENAQKINNSNLKVYNNKNYIVWGNHIEFLDDDFKTTKIFTYPIYDKNNPNQQFEIINKVLYIDEVDNEIKVYFDNNSIMYFDKNTTEYLETEYFMDYDTSITIYEDPINVENTHLISTKGDYEKFLHFKDYKTDKISISNINIKSNINEKLANELEDIVLD